MMYIWDNYSVKNVKLLMFRDWVIQRANDNVSCTAGQNIVLRYSNGFVYGQPQVRVVYGIMYCEKIKHGRYATHKIMESDNMQAVKDNFERLKEELNKTHGINKDKTK